MKQVPTKESIEVDLKYDGMGGEKSSQKIRKKMRGNKIGKSRRDKNSGKLNQEKT